MVCNVAGETCVHGLSAPVLNSDSLFKSLSFFGDDGVYSSPAPTNCKCGKNRSCEGNKSATSCDPKNDSCVCGSLPECSGSTPWCIEDKCQCSSVTTHYGKGDAQSQGTCVGENEKCMTDGTCGGTKSQGHFI